MSPRQFMRGRSVGKWGAASLAASGANEAIAILRPERRRPALLGSPQWKAPLRRAAKTPCEKWDPARRWRQSVSSSIHCARTAAREWDPSLQFRAGLILLG